MQSLLRNTSVMSAYYVRPHVLNPTFPPLKARPRRRSAPLLLASPMTSTVFSSLPFPRFPVSHRRLPPLSAIATGSGGDGGGVPGDASDLRIVFAGGGSGGHIYPALAIADAIRAARPATSIAFLGTASGMESRLVPAAGFAFHPVPKSKLLRPFLHPANLLLPLRLLHSVAVALRLLSHLRPRLVVGTGAYASAPVCLAAAISGIRIVIQEQNCFPGITNRTLAPYAEKIFLAFNSCLEYFPREKCVVAGNPIRISIGHNLGKDEACSHYFPGAAVEEGRRVVLVLGGSTGANALNVAVLDMHYRMLMEKEHWYVIWQTGAEWYEEIRSLAKYHPRLLLVPFLDAMDLAYAAADVVVSRAGAMTCTEILTTGKPSILIPSPTAAEDHQTKNAYVMADLAGSKVLTEDELNSHSLEIAINEVLGDKNLMAEMSEKAMRAARPNASSEISQCILSLIDPSAS